MQCSCRSNGSCRSHCHPFCFFAVASAPLPLLDPNVVPAQAALPVAAPLLIPSAMASPVQLCSRRPASYATTVALLSPAIPSPARPFPSPLTSFCSMRCRPLCYCPPLSHPPGHRPLRDAATPSATLLFVVTQPAATPSIHRDVTCHTATRRPADRRIAALSCRRVTAPLRRRAAAPPLIALPAVTVPLDAGAFFPLIGPPRLEVHNLEVLPIVDLPGMCPSSSMPFHNLNPKLVH